MNFRWRIRHKLAAGLILVVGMIVLLVGGAFYGLYSYRRANNIVTYHQRQSQRLSNLDFAFLDLYHRIFSVTADPPDPNDAKLRESRLSIYRNINDRLNELITELDSAPDSAMSLDSRQKQTKELELLKQNIDKLIEMASVPGPRSGANTPSQARLWWLTEDNERPILVELQNSLSRMIDYVNRAHRSYIDSDKTNYRASTAIVISTSILVLVMLFVLVWFGYESIFYPIRELHRGVIKLAEGEFDSRVEIESGDEMQELADAFNLMADRLAGVYSDLNRQVEDRSRQLIRSERLASVGFLAAGVAHEINNPLASIAFCAEALESRLRPMIPGEGEEVEVVHNYLRMIEQEAFRCKAITEKLLNFSRVGEPERTNSDIVALVRDVLEMVQHLGRSRGKTIIFEPYDNVIARVSPQELKQVLLNLIVNALDSIDEGGAVEIEAHHLGAEVEVLVRDNGCGMTEEVMENLFEPFFTRNRTGKGTGLGLSISHLIISRHGGTLEASSDGPGRGSTFRIQLPVEAAQMAA